MPWPRPLRFLFRFVCCYFVLYCLPGDGRTHILSQLPYDEFIGAPWTWFIHALCPWVAIHLFGLSGQRTTYFPTGSGDTTLAWIENLFFLVSALAGAILWTILDRNRKDYRTLHAWLRVLVRYTLAFTLFSYGFVKVVPLQFQPPRFPRMVEPYGEFSPMGVLWAFMGSSLAYTIFAGAAEVLGGLLLLFRRTTTLGALVSVAVMSNVVALNFCYDVPVKLYSTNLLMMSLFLLAPDMGRLVNVFLLNRPAPPADPMPIPWRRPGLRMASYVVCGLLCCWTLFGEARGAYKGYRQFYADPKHPPIYGLYDVEEMQGGNWRKVWFLDQGLGARTTTDQVVNYPGKYEDGRVIVSGGPNGLTWRFPDAEHLIIEGRVPGAQITARLKRIDDSKFLLKSRGFHWINEFPFNR